MKKKIYNVISIAFLSMMFASCDCDHSINVEIVTAIGAGGDFIVINTTTSDTLKVEGSLSISTDNPVYETLEAHNGNTIKIVFEPKDEYKDYTFETTYTFPNDEVVENQSQYEYIVEDSLEGSYDIHLSASSKGETDYKNWIITAGGAFTLKVIE